MHETVITNYSSSRFILQAVTSGAVVDITFQSLDNILHTGLIPHTTAILKQKLPGVLLTPCTNDKGLTFLEEVERTEIGHLFEHIILENFFLCKPHKNLMTMRGRTDWNWEIFPVGMFHITLDHGGENIPLMKRILDESIVLLEEILDSATITTATNGNLHSITVSQGNMAH